MTDLGVKDRKTNRTFAKNILVFVPLEQNNVSLDQIDTLKKLHNHCKNVPLVDKADLMFNKEQSQHFYFGKISYVSLGKP